MQKLQQLIFGLLLSLLLVTLLGLPTDLAAQQTTKQQLTKNLDDILITAKKSAQAREGYQAFYDDNLPAYEKAIQTFRQNPTSVDFKTLWFQYVDSRAFLDYIYVRGFYDEQLQLVNNGQLACTLLPWAKISARLFFSPDVHQQAAKCFSKHHNNVLANGYKKSADFVRDGMRQSADGKSTATAYEVPSDVEALDFVKSLGVEVFDIYTTLSSDGSGIFFVVIGVNDKNQQQTFYFSYERLIHQMVLKTYPFGSISDGLLKHLAKRNSAYTYALSDYYLLKQDVNKALGLLVELSKQSKPHATYMMAKICSENVGNNDEIAKQCVNFAKKAAELNHAKANILLAKFYREGVGVEANTEQFNRYMRIANEALAKPKNQTKMEQLSELSKPQQQLEPKAWEILATELSPRTAKYRNTEYYKQQAIEKGSVAIAIKQAMSALNVLEYIKGNGNNKNHSDLTAHIDNLDQVAHNARSNYLVKVLNLADKLTLSQTQQNRAIDLLINSAEHGDPVATSALLQLDKILKTEQIPALTEQQQYFYTRTSAEKGNRPAQLQYAMGLHQQQKPALAIKWFEQCALQGDINCTRNFLTLHIAMPQQHQLLKSYVGTIKALVEKQDPDITNNYAYMLEKGIGVEQNPTEASSLYLKAYSLGSYYALGNLCRIGFVGLSVGGTSMIVKCMQLDKKYQTGLSEIAPAPEYGPKFDINTGKVEGS